MDIEPVTGVVGCDRVYLGKVFVTPTGVRKTHLKSFLSYLELFSSYASTSKPANRSALHAQSGSNLIASFCFIRLRPSSDIVS